MDKMTRVNEEEFLRITEKAEVERLRKNQPNRLALKEMSGTRQINARFARIYVDDEETDLVECKLCPKLFRFLSKNGVSSLNRHECVPSVSALPTTTG